MFLPFKISPGVLSAAVMREATDRSRRSLQVAVPISTIDFPKSCIGSTPSPIRQSLFPKSLSSLLHSLRPDQPDARREGPSLKLAERSELR